MKSVFCVLALLFLFGFAPLASNLDTADLVFINGNIYTVNDKQPHAEAIAIKADRIVFVGSNAAAKKYQGVNTRMIDLHGETVLPGMTDAHYHFLGVGQREMNLNLEGITNLEDFLAKVKARVDQAKPGEWVVGRGWIETFWKPPVFPTRWDLDKIAPNNPVFLTRADGHGAVANSAALKLGKVTKETKDPFGGQVLRDKQTGEPTGMLLDNAQSFVARQIPPDARGSDERAAILANDRSLMLGWTQVQDPGGSYEDVELYKKLYGEGKLKIRIYKAVYGPGSQAQRLLRDGPIIEAFNNHLNLRAIKVVSDGALGSRGAALLEPYSDMPEIKGADGKMQRNAGFLKVKDEDLLPRLKGAYAWNSLLKSGVIIPGGSDAPVERGEPMIEFYAAVARKDIRGYSGEGWHPEEKVTREQALKMFTIWPAYVAFEENVRGSIEVGKLADLTILSADIMKIPEMEILKTHCVITVIGGEIVYEAK